MNHVSDIAQSAYLYGPTPEPPALEEAVRLLGGPRILKRQVRTPLEAHTLLMEGLPNAALRHLVDELGALSASIEKAVGISTRTIQRKKLAPTDTLDPVQSGRTWKFAEILARATRIFGSQEEAEDWLGRPAIGLDGERPLDLLSTPAGQELVESHLTRIEYGVYV
jgi:putative toxin-antitoxin system antitoxin component (TIGR02293 family)